jgi:hypothetical protein
MLTGTKIAYLEALIREQKEERERIANADSVPVVPLVIYILEYAKT